MADIPPRPVNLLLKVQEVPVAYSSHQSLDHTHNTKHHLITPYIIHHYFMRTENHITNYAQRTATENQVNCISDIIIFPHHVSIFGFLSRNT